MSGHQLDAIRGLALYALITGGIGFALGREKGLGFDGIVYGLLLGPIGWGIVLLKQPR